MTTGPAATSQRATVAPAPTDDVDRIRLAVLRLARRIRVNAVGTLTPSQHAVFVSIATRGPCTIGEIAEFERVKPPSASKIVATLEELGLVTRETPANDRRYSVIVATPAGLRYLDEYLAASRTWLADRLAELDDAERDVIHAALPAIERLVRSGT